MHTENNTSNKQALITGGAQRLGAAMARHLHAHGYDLILHYRHSASAANQLADQLEAIRPGSIKLARADLADQYAVATLIEEVIGIASNLQLLVNNASIFTPTPIGRSEQTDWNRLIDANLRGGFFLAQGLAETLRQQRGNIINMADIYAARPLAGHAIYNIAKAGVVMMTRTLATELAPQVRVNAIAPGLILWPQNEPDAAAKQALIDKTALVRAGDPADIAAAVLFLAEQADYITGHTLVVDGGRSLCL